MKSNTDNMVESAQSRADLVRKINLVEVGTLPVILTLINQHDASQNVTKRAGLDGEGFCCWQSYRGATNRLVSPMALRTVLMVCDHMDETHRGGTLCCRSVEEIKAHFGQPASRQIAEYKDAEPEVFNRWFPGLKLSSTACPNARQGSVCILK